MIIHRLDKALFIGLLFISFSFAAPQQCGVVDGKEIFKTSLQGRIVSYIIIYYSSLYREIMVGEGEHLDAMAEILNTKITKQILKKMQIIAEKNPNPYDFAINIVNVEF